MFFESWHGLVRIVVVGTCAYMGLVFMLRVSGKRTLAKMNAFDFVVTISLGSVLATTILNRSVPLANGLIALALLCSLQYLAALFSTHSKKFQGLIKTTPTLLVYDGKMMQDEIISQRVTDEEVLAAIRASGIGCLSKVNAVVLETDGSFSVIGGSSNSRPDTLQYVDMGGAEMVEASGR